MAQPYKELYTTLSFFNKVFKWPIPVTYCWGLVLAPAMDKYPVQGMLHAKETGISSSCLGLWLVVAFTFTFFPLEFSQ